MQWVASTLHTTSEHGVSSITTADAHTSAASSRPNWRPRRFKWTLRFAERRNLVSARVPSPNAITQRTCLQGQLRHFKHCQFRPTGHKSCRVSFGRKFFPARDKVCLTHKVSAWCNAVSTVRITQKFKTKTSSVRVHWPLTRTSI